jgi:hypothetical protein
VVWKTALTDPAGYASLSATVVSDDRALHAALPAATTVRRRTAQQRGVLDRRRLHTWSFDDRLFRTARPAVRDVTLAPILDLSGMMVLAIDVATTRDPAPARMPPWHETSLGKEL